VTVVEARLLLPSAAVAYTVVRPAETPVTTPFSSTVATEGSADL
jgi:hypothetical protein